MHSSAIIFFCITLLHFVLSVYIYLDQWLADTSLKCFGTMFCRCLCSCHLVFLEGIYHRCHVTSFLELPRPIMAMIMTFQQRPKPIYPPYGIDFPQGATGRFCNGRTTTDILGPLLTPLYTSLAWHS